MKITHLLRQILRALLILASITPVSYAIYLQWVEVRTTLMNLELDLLLAATLIMCFTQPLMGLISWIILRTLGAKQPFIKVIVLYFISQIAKYLPGGIWAFPGRVMAYQAVGVERTASVVSVVREIIALYLGASLVGFSGVVLGLPLQKGVSITIGTGVVICIILGIFTQVPIFWNWLSRFNLFKSGSIITYAQESKEFNLNWLPGGLFSSLVFWTLTGFGFYLIVVAIRPDVHLLWYQAASIFSLAWCAGFMVVFAPAGLGVREASISLLLAPVMTVVEALSVALLARLWWTASEALFIASALIWASKKPEDYLFPGVKGR